jgi:hypothetical protein
MALYVPLSRRRRNAAVVAAATLLLGLVSGYLVGRSTAVTASEAAASVRAEADTLGTRIEALTIEYEQAVSGTGDTIQGGVLDALDGIDADLDSLIADAPWLGSAQIDDLHSAVDSVRAAATEQAPTNDFATTATAAATSLRETFGVDQ